MKNFNRDKEQVQGTRLKVQKEWLTFCFCAVKLKVFLQNAGIGFERSNYRGASAPIQVMRFFYVYPFMVGVWGGPSGPAVSFVTVVQPCTSAAQCLNALSGGLQNHNKGAYHG